MNKRSASFGGAYTSQPSTERILKRQFRDLTIYVVLATILWVILTCVTFSEILDKKQDLQKTKYTNYCCYCYDKYEGNKNDRKADWGYCLSDGCSSDQCNYYDNSNKTTKQRSCDSIDTKYSLDSFDSSKDWPNLDDDDYDNLSTSAFSYFDVEKDYLYYGYLLIAIGVAHILILWAYLLIYKNIYIGISLFFHGIVNSELFFYFLMKTYQYGLDNSKHCFVNQFDTNLWQFVADSLFMHMAIQWTFSCAKCCCTQCKGGRALYRWWGSIVFVLTAICLLWALAVYILIIVEAFKLFNKIQHLVIVLALFLSLFGIFLFPFCREITGQVVRSQLRCFYIITKKEQFTTYADRFGKEEPLLSDDDETDNESDVML